MLLVIKLTNVGKGKDFKRVEAKSSVAIATSKCIVVIGDGIDWIWNYARDRLHFTLPDGTVMRPVEIVDCWHACEKLAKGRDLIFADCERASVTAW